MAEITIIAITGSNFINVVKCVRELSGLGLKDAKALVDAVAGLIEELERRQPASPSSEGRQP